MTIVFSLGGSVFQNRKIALKYADFFEKLAEHEQVGVVVGGGKLAREYISEMQKKGANDVLQHLAGIAATRQNAQQFCKMLKTANKLPALDFESAYEMSKMYPIIVMGGVAPYFTTDTCTLILAELLNAEKAVNLTDVDYLYDKDPRKFKSAKKISKMSKSEFLKFVLKNDKRRPGEHFIIDSIAAFILEKTKTSLYLLNAKNVNEVKKALTGKKFKGTLVK